MNPKPTTDSRTKLSEDTYGRCWNATLVFLKTNASIRNRELREVTGIEYDQAITFFNRAILEKTLLRKGHASGTHYILAKRSTK
jgi:hypothetical protein